MNLSLKSNTFLESLINSVSNADAMPSSSPEMTMLQIQMIIAENCDSQMKDAAEKLKFMKDVSQTYRSSINKVNTFLANPTKESHHGNKPVIVTSAAQAAELLDSLTTFSYDTTTKTMKPMGIDINDLETKHSINNKLTPDGKTNTLQLSAFSKNLATIEDRNEYIKEIKKLGDNSDLRLPFYYSNKSNDGIDGKPVLTFYVDSIEKLVQVMDSQMNSLDTEIDKLTTSITDLTEKRKLAMESAKSAINKFNEVTTNTINKM